MTDYLKYLLLGMMGSVAVLRTSHTSFAVLTAKLIDSIPKMSTLVGL